MACFRPDQTSLKPIYVLRDVREAEYYDELEREHAAQEAAEQASRRCTSSGQDVGRMIEILGMDDWKVECPTCGAMWGGGGTQLPEHDRPGSS